MKLVKFWLAIFIIVLLLAVPAFSLYDTDRDGVPDGSDLCLDSGKNTPEGSTTLVDEKGCSCDQLACQSGLICNPTPFLSVVCQKDSDFDSVGDLIDNCPSISNPPTPECSTNLPSGQCDSDKNGVGDACEKFSLFLPSISVDLYCGGDVYFEIPLLESKNKISKIKFKVRLK